MGIFLESLDPWFCLYFIIDTYFIVCKKDTVNNKTCRCALTNCGVGRVCVGGTKCEYQGNTTTKCLTESTKWDSIRKVQKHIICVLTNMHKFYSLQKRRRNY